jgi:hypothetical protein
MRVLGISALYHDSAAALIEDDRVVAAWKKRLLFCEHHLSHAASAFFPSPYQQAALHHRPKLVLLALSLSIKGTRWRAVVRYVILHTGSYERNAEIEAERRNDSA